MEKPIFSISTSFYNRGKWVDHVYETIKAQTYPYWEWVVTDDFSTEDSAEERLREIARNDSRVVYYNQSRKKEVFYNPQYGCSGNTVMQLDSDDEMYANLLEIYAKYFMEDPELMGITCGHSMKKDLEVYTSISNYALQVRHNINFAPMARAWRNTIPHFDFNGELNWWQNDTNIIRHIEARGKVLFIPRELYVYNYSGDSISKKDYSYEDVKAIELERVRIENRFPDLDNKDKCTFDLKYLPIDRLSWAFYNCDFNKSTSSKKINFIKADIWPYEKHLLNELYYDHSLSYNGNPREKYDEIVVYLNESTWKYLKNKGEDLKKKYPNIPVRFFVDEHLWKATPEQLKVFGRFSFWNTEGLIHGFLL